MTYVVLGGALNSIHALTLQFIGCLKHRNEEPIVIVCSQTWVSVIV